MKSNASKTTTARRWPWLANLFGAEAAQMVEFALILPLLWVLAVGAFDFGSAYVLKDRLTNAAREGARIASAQSQADLTQTTPPSIISIRDAVVNYLTDANVTTCTIDATPTPGPGPLAWTFSSASTGCSGPILVIERGYTFPATINGNTVQVDATRVTLNYPFTWSFDRAMKLLIPSSNYASSFTISTNAVMQNLSN